METTFSERLEAAMARAGKDRKEMIEKHGFSASRFTAWIGENKLPGGDYLQKLSAVLNVNAHWLLTGEGPMERPAEGGGDSYRSAVVGRAFLEIARIVDEARKQTGSDEKPEPGKGEATADEVEDASRIVADLDNMDNHRRAAGE